MCELPEVPANMFLTAFANLIAGESYLSLFLSVLELPCLDEEGRSRCRLCALPWLESFPELPPSVVPVLR